MHALSSGFHDLLDTKNHSYSISAQSYDFCPHLRKLDILDFTLSCINLVENSVVAALGNTQDRRAILEELYLNIILFRN